MIAVSAAFTAAEVADIAQLAYQVFVVRGNYASTAAFGATITSSGDDASGDYPATGIGDGDRTEINMGATDAADNGVGLSSWKSSTSPTAMAPVWVQIDFGQDRTWNYIKLYNYSGDPLTSYALQWTPTTAACGRLSRGTSDQGSGTGYAGYTGGLDVYDFTAYTGGTTFTHRYLRCLVYTTTSTGPAQIVEIEVYNRVDVTSRVSKIEVDRQRDWKQVNPMAATCKLDFDNSDRYFSTSYTPTAAETAAGYFNAELDEDLGVIVRLGFWFSQSPYYNLGYGLGGFGGGPYGGGVATALANPELAQSFVGTIDAITSSSLRGTTTITARDGMKALLNQTWSTRLKTNIDNGAAITYLLNICNISTYETSVATTGLIQPYFFVYEQSAFTAVQQLVQACGNAALWFDENNKATFQDYLVNSSNSHTDFAWPAQDMGDYTTYGTGTAAQNGNTVTCTGTDTAPNRTDFAITYAATQTQGWQFTASSFIGAIGFMCTQTPTAWAAPGAGGTDFPQGYIMSFSSGTITFYRCDSPGTVTSKLAFAYNGLTLTTWTILRLVNGGTYTFYIYANGVLKGSFSDNTYTTSSYFNVMAPGPGTGGGVGNVVIATRRGLLDHQLLRGPERAADSDRDDDGDAVAGDDGLSGGGGLGQQPPDGHDRDDHAAGRRVGRHGHLAYGRDQSGGCRDHLGHGDRERHDQLRPSDQADHHADDHRPGHDHRPASHRAGLLELADAHRPDRRGRPEPGQAQTPHELDQQQLHHHSRDRAAHRQRAACALQKPDFDTQQPGGANRAERADHRHAAGHGLQPGDHFGLELEGVRHQAHGRGAAVGRGQRQRQDGLYSPRGLDQDDVRARRPGLDSATHRQPFSR
jgi:hypothetical protein